MAQEPPDLDLQLIHPMSFQILHPPLLCPIPCLHPHPEFLMGAPAQWLFLATPPFPGTDSLACQCPDPSHPAQAPFWKEEM